MKNLTTWLIAGLIVALVAASLGLVAWTQLRTPQPTVAQAPTDPKGFVYHYKTSTGGSEDSTEKALAQGSSLEGTGDTTQITNAKLQQGHAALSGGATSGGGGAEGSVSASINSNQWIRWLIGIVGALMVGAGVVALKMLQPVRACVGTMIGGGTLIGAALLPTLADWLLLGGVVFTVGSLWLTGDVAAKAIEALRALRAGISDLAKPFPDAHAALTSKDDGLILNHATPTDLATIAKVVKKDDLI